MTEPHDPFDDDEMDFIVSDAFGDQIADAVAGAQGELDDLTVAVVRLSARLGELVPAAAVINLVTSVAVGAAIKETYG